MAQLKSSDIMNWAIYSQMSESDIAQWYMADFLAKKEELDDPTKLYANLLIKNIIEMDSKEDKSHQDRTALLNYLKELEQLIGIKNQIWSRMIPNDFSYD